MKGSILEFNAGTGKGLIAGEDGRRYGFEAAQWRDPSAAYAGQKVDFEVMGDSAAAIYPDRSAGSGDANKKLVAGLLAILLGAFGVHKFYLGYTKEGLIMLLVFVFGFFLLGLPSFVIGVIALIEGVIYLTKTPEEFDRLYVNGRKPWF